MDKILEIVEQIFIGLVVVILIIEITFIVKFISQNKKDKAMEEQLCSLEAVVCENEKEKAIFENCENVEIVKDEKSNSVVVSCYEI